MKTENKEQKRIKLMETNLFTEEEINFILEDKEFHYEDFDEDDDENYISASEAFKQWMAILDI